MTHEYIFISRFLSSASYCYVPLLPGYTLWKGFRRNSNAFFPSPNSFLYLVQTAKPPLHRVPILVNNPSVQWCIRILDSIPEITFSPLTLSCFRLVAMPYRCCLLPLFFITLTEATAIFLSRPSVTCPLCSRILDFRFIQLILKCDSDELFTRLLTIHHHCSQPWSENPVTAGVSG